MKYLLESEERRLIRALKDSKSATRDLMMVTLFLNTGLRLQECRFLNVGDVWSQETVLDSLVVRADTAKRGQQRLIPINKRTKQALTKYMDWKKRQRHLLEAKAPLFVSRNGNRIAQRTAQDMIEKWCRRAGIGNYTCHSLRHSFSMRLRQRNVRLETIQRLLGHKTLQATGIYLHPSREELIGAVETLGR